MSIKLSIIIPVYNVEKYLSECIESCINQTLDEIEILCINDCSPDNSVKIIEKYQQKDNRIKLINHEKNMGLGAARNTGLQYAQGEYIWFVDSDDFIEKEACQLLYDTAKKKETDILLFQLKTFYDEKDKRVYIEDTYYNDLPKNTNIHLNQLSPFSGNIPVSACSYISKRSFISKYKFRTGVYYEDTDFTPILITEADSIRSITYSAYNRRITPGSITQTNMTQKKYNDKYEVVKSLNIYVENHKIPENSYIDVFTKDYTKYLFDEIINTPFYNQISKDKDFNRIYKNNKKKLNSFAKKYLIKLFKLFLCLIPYGFIVIYRKIKR